MWHMQRREFCEAATARKEQWQGGTNHLCLLVGKTAASRAGVSSQEKQNYGS